MSGIEPDAGSPVPRPRRAMLAALAVRNFRFYFTGQVFSQTGTWFFNLTIALIIVEATGSASALALVTVCQFGPMLLLSPLAGRLADAWPPRRILLIVTGVAIVVSLVLAWVLAAEQIDLVIVYALIVVLGSLQAFERVTGNAFIFELVGASLLQNAVVLSTLVLSLARSFGPGLAGLSFLTLGPSAGLLINAGALGCAFVALLAINPAKLSPRIRPEGATTSMLETVRQVLANPPLRTLMIVNVFVAVATLNLVVVITSIVSIEFRADAGALGAAHALNAIGAVIGGLAITRLHRVHVSTLAPAFLVFGAALAVNAIAPTLLLFLCAAPLLGVGLGVYQGVLNSAAQAVTPPYALGRTMSLLTQANVGMAPIGAILAGLIIDISSARVALLLGATVCGIAAIVIWLAVVRPSRGRAAEPV